MEKNFTIKQKVTGSIKEKKIYEIESSETNDYLLLGQALGINMEHCLALGAKHKENFFGRVSACRIIEDSKMKKILAEAQKNTGKNAPYISVCFYEKLKKGQRFMFIPKRLKIERRPELNNFPLNVMFMSVCEAGNNCQTELTVIYLPDFTTYQEDDKEQKMKYFNSLDKSRKFWLEIIYSKEKGSYTGNKFCGEKFVGGADGKRWDTFFIHLTLLGVSQDAPAQ